VTVLIDLVISACLLYLEIFVAELRLQDCFKSHRNPGNENMAHA